MKRILVLGLMLFSANAFAAWTENVQCSVERGSVDTLDVVLGSASGVLEMDGPHNGETGEVVLQSDLIPSYKVTFSKVSGGRTETAQLTTQLGGRIMAMASADMQQADTVTNRFITQNGDYQITITCRTAPAIS